MCGRPKYASGYTKVEDSSFYNVEADNAGPYRNCRRNMKLVLGTGPSEQQHYWFTWKCDPLPGNGVAFRRLERQGL